MKKAKLIKRVEIDDRCDEDKKNIVSNPKITQFLNVRNWVNQQKDNSTSPRKAFANLFSS